MNTIINSLRYFLDVTIFYLLCGGLAVWLVFGAINQAMAHRHTDNPVTVAGYTARGIPASGASKTAIILSLLFLALIGVTLYLFWKYT